METVLSTPKYRRIVELAKQYRFTIHLVYVLLDSPERNVERVRARVLAGGHDVSVKKVIERYWRSLRQLPWFLENADSAEIFDNSGAEIRRVAQKVDGEILVASDAPVNLLTALTT